MRLHWIAGNEREYSVELYDTLIDGSVPSFAVCAGDGKNYYRELKLGTVPGHSFVVQEGTTDTLFLREFDADIQMFPRQETFYELLVNETSGAFVRQLGGTYLDWDYVTISIDSKVPIEYTAKGYYDDGSWYWFRGITGFMYRNPDPGTNYILPRGGTYQRYTDSTFTTTASGLVSVEGAESDPNVRLYRRKDDDFPLNLRTELYWENE